MFNSKPASLELVLDWRSLHATHRERVFLPRADLWRDVIEEDLCQRLRHLEPGAELPLRFTPGQLPGAYDASRIHRVRRWHFPAQWRGQALTPARGRFFPQGLLAKALDCTPQDLTPLRLLDVDADWLTADCNHPLAMYPLQLTVRSLALHPGREERGGASRDVVQAITGHGPGMQAPHPCCCSGFLPEFPLARPDERPDAGFYAQPRLVPHIDRLAAGHISALYARLLRPSQRVLDLMSSWTSHLPDDLADLSVCGLGMNADELAQNARLDSRVVHDLNAHPRLPYDSGEFDAVLCALSVEYLTRPLAVFAEVARVLKPGGWFVCSFSERWFPPKAPLLWEQLHPFERLGLVQGCYLHGGMFDSLHTETVRGQWRPQDDKYAAQLAYADPLYAVWGRRAR